MATYTAFASGTPTTTGSSWTNSANATGANNAAFATFTSATSAAVGAITLPSFGSAGLAAGSTISTVTATVYNYVATVSRWTSASAQLLDSTGAAVGATVALTLSATTTNSQVVTFPTAPTVAQVNAGLQVKISATKSGTTSSTFNLDAVSLSVGYTAPAPTTTLPFTETFTGTTGSAWPVAWTTGNVPTLGTNGSATIQANAGALVSPSSSTYDGYRAYLTSSFTNFDVSVTITASTQAEAYLLIAGSSDLAQSSSNPFNPQNAYAFEVSLNSGGSAATSEVKIFKMLGGTQTVLGVPLTTTVTAGVAYGVRLQLNGTAVRGKFWDTSAGSEPTAWTFDTVDSGAQPPAGTLLIESGNGNAAAAYTWTLDNLSVSDPTAGSSFSASVALAGSGALGSLGASVSMSAPSNLAGAGVLVATATVRVSSAVTLSGAGSLGAPTVTPRVATAAALSAGGALAVVGVPAPVAASALSGSGGLAASRSVMAASAASLSAAGGLAATGTVNASSATGLAGSGNLAVALNPNPAASVGFSGGGSLGQVATAIVSQPVSLPYTETWTGSDGSAWPSPWTQFGGGTADIQGNSGRIVAAAGSYGTTIESLNTGSPLGDTDVTGTVVGAVTGVEQYVFITVNIDGTFNSYQPNNGYNFMLWFIDSTQARAGLYQELGGVETQLGAFGPQRTQPANTSTSFRVQRIGQVFRGRFWGTGSAEPTDWDVSYTLTDTPMVGGVSVSAQRGDPGLGAEFAFDNVTVSVPATPAFTAAASFMGSGSLSASGSPQTPGVVTETWTGVDGDPWPSQWETLTRGAQTVPASISILNNAGHIDSGSGQGWGYSSGWAQLHDVPVGDVDLVVDVALTIPAPGDEGYATILLSASDDFAGTGYPQTGAEFDFGLYQGVWSIDATTQNNGTQLLGPSVPFSGASGAPFRFHIRQVGQHLWANVWAKGSAEPAGWMIDWVDPSIPVGGKVRFGAMAGSMDTVAVTVDYDNLTLQRSQAVAFAGAGTLTAPAPIPTFPVALAFAGTGTLTQVAVPSGSSAVVLSGSGGMTAGTPTPALSATQALSGSGALTSATVGSASASAAFASTGVLAPSGRASIGAPVGLTASGALTASGSASTRTSVAFAAAGSLAATATPTAITAVVFAGTGGLVVARGPITAGTLAALTGVGALAASGSGVLAGSANLNGSGALVVAASMSTVASVALSATGSLAGVLSPRVSALVTLAGSGVLLAQSSSSGSAAVMFAATGMLASLVTVASRSTVALAASGALAVSPILSVAAVTAFSAVGSLAPTSSTRVVSAALFAGSGLLAAVTTYGSSGSVAASASGALLGVSFPAFSPLVSLAAVGSLESGSRSDLASSVGLAAVGRILAVVGPSLGGSGSFSALGALAYVAAVQIFTSTFFAIANVRSNGFAVQAIPAAQVAFGGGAFGSGEFGGSTIQFGILDVQGESFALAGSRLRSMVTASRSNPFSVRT